MKGVIEDGYLEYSFGRDGVWFSRNAIRSYYITRQTDYIGICFVKGLMFSMLRIWFYFLMRLYGG